jgi:hypothetical protein
MLLRNFVMLFAMQKNNHDIVVDEIYVSTDDPDQENSNRTRSSLIGQEIRW